LGLALEGTKPYSLRNNFAHDNSMLWFLYPQYEGTGVVPAGQYTDRYVWIRARFKLSTFT